MCEALTVDMRVPIVKRRTFPRIRIQNLQAFVHACDNGRDTDGHGSFHKADTFQYVCVSFFFCACVCVCLRLFMLVHLCVSLRWSMYAFVRILCLKRLRFSNSVC